MKLAIDLYCGLGGWAEGLLAEGYIVIGFDIERHDYGTGGYPGKLVIQDVRTLDGARFKDAAVIVASPPCQEFSYMAMPWSRAKEIAAALQGRGEFPDDYTGSRTVSELTALFDACFSIQREASAAAGHRVPLIVENVCGAQKWVGRAKWHYGSYYLWGDVPALMPIVHDGETNWHSQKVPGFRFDGSGKSFQTASVNATKGTKPFPDHGWTAGTAITLGLENYNGIKQGGEWWHDPNGLRRLSSRSNARKAASAMIAKIPPPLARHIARFSGE
jgi:hypothetical protein